jgi:hypothetical protein
MTVMMMPGKVTCRQRAIKPQSAPPTELAAHSFRTPTMTPGMPAHHPDITFVKTAFKAPPSDLY